MTLKDYFLSLPEDRRARAADDINEAAAIEAEHAQKFGAPATSQPGDQETGEPAAPANSFDVTDTASVTKFLTGLKKSHPWLVDKLRVDETAWDEALKLDQKHFARLQADGGFRLSDQESEEDRDYFRWAATQGILDNPSNFGDKVAAFGRGLWTVAKGAVKTAAMAATADGTKLAATAVEGAQQGVSEYKQLGAGLAALLAENGSDVELEAMYALARYSQQEEARHGEWRRKISDSFAEVEVDEDAVEFMSELTDISNLAGAGLGRAVVKGASGVGMHGVAKALAKEAPGSNLARRALAKVPVLGRNAKRAALLGQADELQRSVLAAKAPVEMLQQEASKIRATIAANGGDDALFSELRNVELALGQAKITHEAVESQLNVAREKALKFLDTDGRSALSRAASGTVRASGRALEWAGDAATRLKKKAASVLTGEVDETPAFDAIAGTVLPAASIASKGNIITRAGRDIRILGETWAHGEATLPFYRRVQQAHGVSGFTRGLAAFADNSYLGWAVGKVGVAAKAAAAGAPVSGAFGYVASGGDTEAAFEAAGGGGAFGIGGGALGAWEAYRDPRFRFDELVANRRAFRDWLPDRPDGQGESQLRIFDQLPVDDQLGIATYAHAHPDAAFRFVSDPEAASGWYDRDNNVIVLNAKSKTPLADVFRHEVAHFVERHGLEAPVRDAYLGNAEKGLVGEFTAIGKDGKPVIETSIGPDGAVVQKYVLNEAGKKMKADYEARVRKFDPSFVASDEYFASELFAEQYADRLFNGGFRRDLKHSPVDAFVNAPLLKGFLGKLGLLFDNRDNVVGTGVFKGQSRNHQISKLISTWNRASAKAERPDMDDAAASYEFTETDLRNPELAAKWLQSGGAMKFDADGRPVYNSSGVPQFLTDSEAKEIQRDLANELITEIERYAAQNPAEADVLQRREIVDVKGHKRVVFSGRTIPAEVIDKLEAQKRFNPHQLAHLRALSATVKAHGVGAMVAHFYQAATSKLTGKAYKSVAGRWRRDGVVGFTISKDGNVLVESVSWEQLHENVKKAAKTKAARRAYATAGEDIASAMMADIRTYLNNVIDGKPGDQGIGEARRDVLNNTFGIRMASNADVNPLHNETRQPKTILTSLRLDRMNRVSPLDYVEHAWGPVEYRRVKMNLRPESDLVPFDHLDRETKDDVVAWLSENVPALDSVDVRANLEGLVESPAVRTFDLAPQDIVNLNARATSAVAVKKYVEMMEAGSTPPAVLVQRVANGWKLLEGGHRAKAALTAKVNVPAVDMTPLVEADWEKWVNNEDGHQVPTVQFRPEGQENLTQSNTDAGSQETGEPGNRDGVNDPDIVMDGPVPGMWLAGKRERFMTREGKMLTAAQREQLLSGVDSTGEPGDQSSRGNGRQLVGDDSEGGRLEHAVPEESLTLIHYTGSSALEAVDPKFHGRGAATARDRAGADVGYFFLKDSPLGADQGLINGEGKNVYGAKVPGGRIYDGRTEDPLGYRAVVNRVEADETLKSAGYDGVLLQARDGRQVVKMFKATPVRRLTDADPTLDRAGGGTQYHPGALVFASPNETELDYPSAVSALDAETHKGFAEFARSLAPDAAVEDAVGVWADGAENTVAMSFPNAKTLDETRVLAAKLGIKGNQKAVLHVVAEENGPDAVFEVKFPDGVTLDQAQQAMADSGLEFRTLVRRGSGVTGLVFDEGQKLGDQIAKLTAHDTRPEIESYAARGEFLGSWTDRAEGQSVFQRVLEEAARSGSEAGQDVRGVDSSRQYRVDGEPPLGKLALDAAQTQTFANQTEAADFLGTLARRRNRGLDRQTPNALEALAQLMDGELELALSMPANASAVGWYGAEMDKTFEILNSPELALELHDPTRRGVFSAILSITSNGQEVIPQFLKTAELYDGWRKSGTIPDPGAWGGERAKNIRTHLKFLDTLIRLVGAEATVNFLKEDRPLRDQLDVLYRMVAEAEGLPADATVKVKDATLKRVLGASISVDELKDYVAVGAIVFGPKLGGGFFANLYGKFDRLTMDRWFMRTFHRLTGRLGTVQQERADRNLAKVRESLRSLGKPQAEWGDRKLANWFWDAGKKEFKAFKEIKRLLAERPDDPELQHRDLMRRAWNDYQKAVSGLYDVPDNGGHRKFIREVLERVHELREQRGAPKVETSDMQAILWYLEKDIWANLKKKSSNEEDVDVDADDDSAGRVSYSDGARELYRQKTGKEYIGPHANQ